MQHTVKTRNLEIGAGMPKICAPITGRTEEMILKQAGEIAASGADLAEWRVDFYENFKEGEKIRRILTALKQKLGQIPLIFTFRTKSEGGNCQIEREDYVKLNLLAAQSGCADLVDVEILFERLDTAELTAQLQGYHVFVVASNHHFDRTPSGKELNGIFDRMEAAGADIYKAAVMPQVFTDVTGLMAFTWEQSRRRPRPLVTMSMGELGAVTRMNGESFGSAITFGSVGEASAPGQIPVSVLREILQNVHRYAVPAK